MTDPAGDTDGAPASALAVALIKGEEGCPDHPYWAGGLSGIAIGYGDDLGYRRLADFRAAWGPWLPATDLAALACAIGVRGEGARRLLEEHGLARIRIPRPAADAVFATDELPTYEAEALDALPGLGKCPRDVIGALVSTIYNRGPAMAEDPADPNHDRRRELRAIRTAVAAFAASQLVSTQVGALHAIANQLDTMGDRLWPTEEAPDPTLRNRRHHEAALVRQAASTLALGATP